MMMFDRKKALNMIMGPLPKEGVEVDPAHTLAKEAIEAVKSGDHAGFANATKALFLHYGQQDPGNASEEHLE